MPEELLQNLLRVVTRLEERGSAMEDKFNLQILAMQKEIASVTSSLQEASRTINIIKQVLIMFVCALVVSGVDVQVNLPKVLQILGIGN